MQYPRFEEKNMAAILFNRAQTYRDKVHLKAMYRDGRRFDQWQSYTWKDTLAEVEKLITAWNVLGLKPQEPVAVLGKNRPRWVHSAVSLIAHNATVVPVYPTLVASETAFILRDSGARYLVCESLEQVQKITPALESLPALERIFVMEPIGHDGRKRIGSYEELLGMAEGKVSLDSILARVREIRGDDVATLIYTSGTTGQPKGAMLTHANFLSQRVLPEMFGLCESDVFLNHMPFCHAFGLTTDLLATALVGATLAINDGFTPEEIRFGLGSIRPTVLMSVPRLFEKLYVEVHRVVDQKPAMVQKIFKDALGVGLQVFQLHNAGRAVPLGLSLKHRLARRVIDKVRHQAGLDRLRIAFAGGGPTSHELCAFFQSLGIDIYQGYGLTETSPICSVNLPGKNKLGTVGPAMPGVEQRIAPDGEILIRGRNLMKGYHNNPGATAEAIDDQGWFHTGDIGKLDEDGYLTITDRKKELIITSGGKNIAPLAVESAFNMEAYIETVVAVGDARPYLVALICPNFELLRDWAEKKGLRFQSDAELVGLPEVIELIGARVLAVNQTLARFAQIKKFAILDHAFSETSGELTPSQKLKRRVIYQKYKNEIDALYEDKK